MQCPKTYFVRVLVLSEIYVDSFSNYHMIKRNKSIVHVKYFKYYNKMIQHLIVCYISTLYVLEH